MTTKYHISPSTGNPGPCSAVEGKCPFGEDSPHFETKDGAREHFEKSNANAAVPAPKQTSARTLSQNAKSSSDPVELLEVGKFGTERALKNLAGNKNATEESLARAFKRTLDRGIRIKLQVNANFPAGLMEADGIKAARKNNPMGLRDRMKSDGVSNAQALVVAKDYPVNTVQSILENPNNRVTIPVLTEIAEMSPHNIKAAVSNNPKYDLNRRLPKLSYPNLRAAALATNDHEIIDKAVKLAENHSERSNETDFVQSTLGNKAMSAETIDYIASTPAGQDYHTKQYICGHPNVSEETKARLSA